MNNVRERAQFRKQDANFKEIKNHARTQTATRKMLTTYIITVKYTPKCVNLCVNGGLFGVLYAQSELNPYCGYCLVRNAHKDLLSSRKRCVVCLFSENSSHRHTPDLKTTRDDVCASGTYTPKRDDLHPSWYTTRLRMRWRYHERLWVQWKRCTTHMWSAKALALLPHISLHTYSRYVETRMDHFSNSHMNLSVGWVSIYTHSVYSLFLGESRFVPAKAAATATTQAASTVKSVCGCLAAVWYIQYHIGVDSFSRELHIHWVKTSFSLLRATINLECQKGIFEKRKEEKKICRRKTFQLKYFVGD